MFEHVVVGTDFSPAGERLLKELPALRHVGAKRLNLVHVTGVRHPTISMLEQLSTHRKQLESACSWLESEGFEAKHQVVMGDPSRELTRVASDCDASLIMVGSRSQSRKRDAFVGSVAWGVVNQAFIPVLIVRLPASAEALADGSSISFDQIVFPTDLSPMADKAFRTLEALTRGEAVHDVLIVHVASKAATGTEERRTLEQLGARLGSAGARSVELVIRRGDAVEEILKVAGEQPGALLAMGSHGKGMLVDAVLGSVSRAVVRRAHGSVLLVPSRARPA
jgi:nucleotide-binding universal stress UspA family protein